MDRRVASCLAVLMLAACGGTPFTATEDDASVSSDATTDDATGGDGGVSDGGKPAKDGSSLDGGTVVEAGLQTCHVLSDAGTPCPSDMYCASGTCGAGYCLPKPTSENLSNTATVCGCDGVSYYNDSVAHRNGMAVRSIGGCSGPETKLCTTLQAFCPPPSKCNLGQQAGNVCSAALNNGYCFVMPDTCPAGPKGTDCQDGKCYTQCEEVKAGKLWWNSACQ